MENRKNLLVTLASKDYIEQAKQLFSSVYWNAGWKGDYMLLAHDIPEKELKWFRDKGILVRKCKPLSFLKITSKHHPVVFDKFYLFTPEFKKWKHIIYLDGDIIVRGPIEELTRTKGFSAGKSGINFYEQFSRYLRFSRKRIFPRVCMQSSKIARELFQQIKEKYPPSDSFNSGVMAFDSSIITENSFDRLIQLSKKYAKICFCADEGIFNLLFYKKWKKIPFPYNIWPYYLSFLYEVQPEKIKGDILHFVWFTNDKRPWHSDDFFYREWEKNLERAEFIDLSKIQTKKTDSLFGKLIFLPFFLLIIKSFFFFSYYTLIAVFKKLKDFMKTLKFFIRTLKYMFYKFVGQTGIFIKEKSPNLYYKLKKIKYGI